MNMMSSRTASQDGGAALREDRGRPGRLVSEVKQLGSW